MTTAASNHSFRQAFIDSVRSISGTVADFVSSYESSQNRVLRQGEIDVPVENAFAVISPQQPKKP